MRQFIPLLLLLLLPMGAMAQTSQVTFGKNRVQYHRDFDDWMQYESDNFITYWYGEGRNIGQAVVQMAELDFPYVQRILEHRMNEKVQIIVYVDLTDLKQSNLGNDEVFTNTAGRTKFVGNKVFVYFNGDHNDLRRQVREGIAGVYLEAMLFGSNLQEIVQNAVLMNLPPWFTQGLTSFVGENWNTTYDNQLRLLLGSDQYKNFDALAKDYPDLAGHAFWYYIHTNYGASTVSNLLYLTRINRNIDEGFLYVLGSSYPTIVNSWLGFFRQRYQLDGQSRQIDMGQSVSIRNKRQLPLTQLEISPDGRYLAYVLNDLGRYKVYLHELATGHRRRIFSDGFRNNLQSTDYNYPLLAWSPSAQELSVVYEQRDKAYLLRYDLPNEKSVAEEFSTEFQRINSIAYITPSILTLSATARGFSDIFLYYPATRQSQRVTADFWDDQDPVAVQLRNRPGLIFSSNRPDSLLQAARMDTLLPILPYDLFYYNLESKSTELVRITRTSHANERQPMAIDTAFFSFVTDESGIYNRARAHLEDYIHHYEQLITLKDGTQIQLPIDSSLNQLDTTLITSISQVPILKERAVYEYITDYNVNIISQSGAPRVGKFAQLMESGMTTPTVYLTTVPLDSSGMLSPRTTVFQAERNKPVGANTLVAPPPTPRTPVINSAPPVPAEPTPAPPVEPTPTPAAPAATDSTQRLDITNYLFQSQFEDEPTPSRPAAAPTNNAAVEEVVMQSPTTPPAIAGSESVFYKPKTPAIYLFRPGKIIPYRPAFRTDFVTFNMDNSLLFEGLDSYAANPNGFNFQPLGLLLKANFKDLLEDYVIEGGMRLPTSFNGTEYFLTMQNRKRRLDKNFAVYRRNMRFAEEGVAFVPWRRENNVVLAQMGVRYPLDIFRSLRATATVRRDRVQYLGTDNFALSLPAQTEQRAGLRLEYVFDNTIDMALNLRQGTRYKVFVEAYKSFAFGNGLDLEVTPGYMGVLAADFRHYQRLDKRSILAVRVAGAASFGAQKILYYLGDTDNSLLPSFNQSIPVGNENNRLTTLANNLRGFNANSRNGNAYLLLNSEVRVPIFRYFSERIRSPFLRNFQAVGFFDVGTAWSGPNPYSDENPLNTATFPDPGQVTNPSVQVRVVYFRNPIIAGYGIGARALIFGYLLRLDYAWGIETRDILPPKLHLSLGVDF